MASSSDTLLQRVLARVEEQETRVAELTAENAAKDARIAELEAENADLKRRLGLDSTTSSTPPSSDGPATKPAPRSLRSRSGKKPGKQPGDEGTTLCQTAEPDRVLDHVPATCGGCERPLDAARYRGLRRCQVVDLPEAAGLEVTEHRYHRLVCACGHATAPEPDPGADAPASYGPRISALGLLLAVPGLHMILTWPLPSGGFPFDNIIFGEPSLVFGVVLLIAAMFLWKRGGVWPLTSVPRGTRPTWPDRCRCWCSAWGWARSGSARCCSRPRSGGSAASWSP